MKDWINLRAVSVRMVKAAMTVYELFPNGKIARERFLGRSKSYIAMSAEEEKTDSTGHHTAAEFCDCR